MMVFSGNANPELAQRVASRLYLSLGKADVGKFSDGEIAVELNENVRGKDVAQGFERVARRGHCGHAKASGQDVGAVDDPGSPIPQRLDQLDDRLPAEVGELSQGRPGAQNREGA